MNACSIFLGWGAKVGAKPIEPGEKDHPLAGVASFLFEMGHLKRVPRSGWLLLGVPEPETIAEHSFRVGLMGMALAAIEGADMGRTAVLSLAA